MAKQTLNVGFTPNDGTGNTLRDGGVKIQANFDELYTALGGNTPRILIPGTSISNGATLKFDGTNFVPNTDIDTNTTYAISAETVTSGAKVRLTGSDTTTDDISILSANAGLTIARTDANTITLTNNVSTITYGISIESIVSGQRAIRLGGSSGSIDDVNIIAGAGLSISNPDASNIQLEALVTSVNGAVGAVDTRATFTYAGTGNTNYTVTGRGLATAGESDPTIIVQRGETYKFTNTRVGQILEILDSSDVAPATDYISSTGSTRNEADQNQTITFTIPMSAATGNTYKYRSKANPGTMLGTITVI